MNEYRTHNCGQIRKENVGETVKIAGWIQTIRDLGGLVFLDIRDQYGITQVVISNNDELVEVTPVGFRLRKKILKAELRKKANNRDLH